MPFSDAALEAIIDCPNHEEQRDHTKCPAHDICDETYDIIMAQLATELLTARVRIAKLENLLDQMVGLYLAKIGLSEEDTAKWIAANPEIVAAITTPKEQ